MKVEDKKTNGFLLGTGAEYHMVRELMHDVIKIPYQTMKSANHSADIEATHLGNLWIRKQTGDSNEPTHVE